MQKLSTTETQVLRVLNEGPKAEHEIRRALIWGIPLGRQDWAKRSMLRVLDRLEKIGAVKSAVNERGVVWQKTLY